MMNKLMAAFDIVAINSKLFTANQQTFIFLGIRDKSVSLIMISKVFKIRKILMLFISDLYDGLGYVLSFDKINFYCVSAVICAKCDYLDVSKRFRVCKYMCVVSF